MPSASDSVLQLEVDSRLESLPLRTFWLASQATLPLMKSPAQTIVILDHSCVLVYAQYS